MFKKIFYILFGFLMFSINSFGQTEIEDSLFVDITDEYADSIQYMDSITNENHIFYYPFFCGNYEYVYSSFKENIKYLWITFEYVVDDNINHHKHLTKRYDNLFNGCSREDFLFPSRYLYNVSTDFNPLKRARIQFESGKIEIITLNILDKGYYDMLVQNQIDKRQ